MSFIRRSDAAEWWKAPDLASMTIFRFDEDPRVRLIWRAVGWGKTWRDDFGLDDAGGLVLSPNAVAVISMSRDDKMPGVRLGKEFDLVPVIIWPLLAANRKSKELAQRLISAFEKLGMKEREALIREIRIKDIGLN
jgi:hypothetical protein